MPSLIPGSGNSSSSATSSNQNLGAQGNTAPIFNVSFKGGKGSSANSNSRSNKSSATRTRSKVQPTTAGTGTPGTAALEDSPELNPQNSSASGEQLNVSVVQTTSDVNADNNLAAVATSALGATAGVAGGAIAANTALAQYSIDAQNAALTQSNALASGALGLAGQLASASLEQGGSVVQSGEELAALGYGANPNDVAAGASPNIGTTEMLLLLGALVGIVALFRN